MSLKSVTLLSVCVVSLARVAEAETPEARVARENADAVVAAAGADAELPLRS